MYSKHFRLTFNLTEYIFHPLTDKLLNQVKKFKEHFIMARTIRKSNTLPSWEAEKLKREQRKENKLSRNASSEKRNSNDNLHKVDDCDYSSVYHYNMA